MSVKELASERETVPATATEWVWGVGAGAGAGAGAGVLLGGAGVLATPPPPPQPAKTVQTASALEMYSLERMTTPLAIRPARAIAANPDDKPEALPCIPLVLAEQRNQSMAAEADYLAQASAIYV